MIVPPEKVEDSAIPMQNAPPPSSRMLGPKMGGKDGVVHGGAERSIDGSTAGSSGLHAVDPPPAYGDRGQSTPSAGAPMHSELQLQSTQTKFASSQPTNFLHLTAERNWIKGHFTINPFLTIPPFLLSPLAPGESEADRKNLRFAARMGHIDAEITLVGPQRDEQRAAAANLKRTSMEVTCDHGMANLAIRTVDHFQPYTLRVVLKNASSTIRIPNTFMGLITINAERSWVKLGTSLSTHSAPMSQVGSTSRWFVGDISAICDGDWLGDVIEIQGSHSRVKVKYVDKTSGEDGEVASKPKGFWSRLAGKS